MKSDETHGHGECDNDAIGNTSNESDDCTDWYADDA